MLLLLDDDDHDRRPQRRRYEEPLANKLRKQLLHIAESVSGTSPASLLAGGKVCSREDIQAMRNPQEEVGDIGRTIADNFDDEDVKANTLDLLIQLCVPLLHNAGLLKLTPQSVLEQPLKVPFVAAVVLYANDSKPEVAQEVLSRAGAKAQTHLDAGNWRELKLLLRFFACLHNLFQEHGVFPLLDELFNRAVDLQAASQEDVYLGQDRCLH